MERVIVGTDGGLDITLGELYARLGDEALGDADRQAAEEHVEAVLLAGAGPAGARQGMGRRVRPGRYLAVGDLGQLGVAVLLGPLLHLVAAGGAIRGAKRLLAFDRSWRPRLVAIYAQLDGMEREVFEAIHALQSEWVVTNFDAIEARRFEEAYGREAPTAARIERMLSGTVPREAIQAVLEHLVARRIVGTDAGRYWIRF